MHATVASQHCYPRRRERAAIRSAWLSSSCTGVSYGAGMETSRSSGEAMRRGERAADDEELGNDAVVSVNHLAEETDPALTELLRRTRGPLDWQTLPARDAATAWE